MTSRPCPQCGLDLPADATACAKCGCPLNGLALPNREALTQQPPPLGASPAEQLSPELKAWARQEFNEEEFLAGLREIEETGGLELKDFLQELEQEAARND